MNWLWGNDNSMQSQHKSKTTLDQSSESKRKFDKNTIDTTKLTGFDPTMLERGAEALKAIEMSRNSDKVLELLVEQEKTKQINLRESQKINEIEKKVQLFVAKKSYEEEAQKTTAEKAKIELKLSEEKSKMEEERVLRLINEREKSNHRWMKNKNRMVAEQQKIIRETERIRSENEEKLLKQKTNHKIAITAAKEESTYKGKIKQQRENADIFKDQMTQKLNLKHNHQLNILNAKLDFVSKTTDKILDKFSDPKNASFLFLASSSIFFSYFGCKYSFRFFGKILETRLGKPSLVRETSRFNFIEPISSLRAKFHVRNASRIRDNLMRKGAFTSGNIFTGVFLNEEVRNRLKWLSEATSHTAKSLTPFQNIMLYGPPGTGKSLFSKKLAIHSGMHYAIMSGGDFSQLGNDAVTEIHKVFDWAEKSRRGTLIFIDEADSIFRKGRNTSLMSESMRNVLSAFLYRTGSPSNKVMIVLATNVPSSMDRAIVDRIDESIFIPMPGLKERSQIFDFQIREQFEGKLKAKEIFKDKTKLKNFCDWLAEQTDEINGRGIQKIIISLQHATFNGRIKGNLTFEKAKPVLEDIIDNFKKR